MCTLSTNKIYLCWKKEPHSERFPVGVLSKEDGHYTFKYLDIKRAQENGFQFYPAFQDTTKTYPNAIDVFKLRLPSPDRRDYNDFLKYWCAEDFKDDVFSILALTGARLATDNFDFIAPHDEVPAVFYTELAGLFHHKPNLSKVDLKTNIPVLLEKEPNNKYDNFAVKVLINGIKIGYIQKIHSTSVFNAIEKGLTVHAIISKIIANGEVRNILLKVEIKNH